MTAPAVAVDDLVDAGAGLAHLLDHLHVDVAGREDDEILVLAASIFHYGECTICEAKRFMAAAGLPIRLD